MEATHGCSVASQVSVWTHKGVTWLGEAVRVRMSRAEPRAAESQTTACPRWDASGLARFKVQCSRQVCGAASLSVQGRARSQSSFVGRSDHIPFWAFTREAGCVQVGAEFRHLQQRHTSKGRPSSPRDPEAPGDVMQGPRGQCVRPWPLPPHSARRSLLPALHPALASTSRGPEPLGCAQKPKGPTRGPPGLLLLQERRMEPLSCDPISC